MDKDIPDGSLDKILKAAADDHVVPFSVKDDGGKYVFANEAWSELADAPPHRLVGRRDDQLPWGDRHGAFITQLDDETRRHGMIHRIDRRPHFKDRVWIRSTTDKHYLPNQHLLISRVDASPSDEFCQLASQTSEHGLCLDGISLSIKQLYLLHQLLFHVPQKQSARELGCSTHRINQYLRDLREKFDVEDSKELMCVLSAQGFFPLLEHFDLLFKHGWLAPELRFN